MTVMAGRRSVGIAAGGRVAYVTDDDLVIPECLADLECIPGRCHSRAPVVQCPQSSPGIVCTDCAMTELGEHWSNFKARTNAGTPKALFYKRLNEEQSRSDPDFARLVAAFRAKQERG